MKRTFRLILTVAAAAIGLSACQKELEQPSGKTVHFTASEVETKTTFTEQSGNTFPVIWQQGDQVKVFLNNSSDNAQTVAVIPSSDGTKAHYDVTVGIQADSYDFGFISPASAALKAEGGNYPCMVVEIPSVQTPTATSVDPAAQVLYSYVYGISPLHENMNVTMHHATAYAKINFKNLDCGKETVSSIVMTAEMNIAGQWYIFPNQNNITNKYDGHYYRPGSKTITINTHSLNDVWVALGPWDSFGGNVEFTVNTTGGKYKKTVNIPNRRLHYGDVVLMNVDMAGIEVDNGLVYRKVTDASALTPGTQVIIASDDRLHALGTTQRNTNRASASVINTGTVIFKPSKDVQILTVEKGAAAGTVAFNTGSGYLYTESAYNYLKTQDEKDGSSSWTVNISNGVTTSISTLGREIRYNEGADIFSAYTSGQIPVSIFALDPDATFKNTQIISLGFESTSMTAGLSFQLHPSYSRTPVTYKSSDESVVTVSASGYVQTVSEGTAFITATAEEDDDYYSSSATVTIKVIPEKTVSELQKNEDAAVVGIVTAISTKGFILSDETGSIFVYKMDETEGNITIGRRIGVAGTIGEYAKGLQYGQDCVLSYHYYAGIVTPSYPEPVELDEEAIAAFVSKPAATTAQYVTFAADVIDERNLIVGGGSTANVTTYYITPELKDVINANKHIIVKGYATFVQSGKCSVVVTDVQKDLSNPDMPDSLNFPQSGSWGGTYSFPLTVPWLQELANNGWTIKVSCDGTVFSRVTWYTSKLIYTIEDNLGSEPRTGWLKITVTKDGKSFEKTYYYSQGVLSH